MLRLLNLLVQTNSAPSQIVQPTGYSPSLFQLALNRVIKTAKPGSLIFLLSDFREWDKQAKNSLIRLSSQ